jgi:hypothetical protein
VARLRWCNRTAFVRDTAGIDTEPACRLVQKLREFAQTRLDPDERALLAVLLAPGVARAYEDDETVTAGVPAVEWSTRNLPDSLVRALRTGGIRVVGLDCGSPTNPARDPCCRDNRRPPQP